MRTRQRLRLGLASSVLGIATLIPATATEARPTTADWLGGVPDSADLSSEAVVSGHVRDGRGRPAGGRAVLVAFPPQEVMSAAKVGDSVRLRPIGKAPIDSTGAYVLRVDPAIRLRDFASKSRVVDLEVLVAGPAGSTSHAFSRKLDAGGGIAPEVAPIHGSRSRTIASTIDLTVEQTPTPIGSDRTRRLAAPPIYCTSTLKQLYTPVWVLVAELYPGPHATVDFTYSAGAQSTLGVGVSVSGSAGSFSQGGKITVGSSGSVNFATVPQNQRRVQQTQWRYAKWDLSCPTAPHYEARPHSWVGGSTYYTPASTPSAPYCTPYLAGDRPSIDQHKAIEWSNGVRISGIIGVDLSTTTGFTTKAAQQWTFLSSGRLCGTNDYPFQARTTVGK
jgi:hypothetical protein